MGFKIIEDIKKNYAKEYNQYKSELYSYDIIAKGEKLNQRAFKTFEVAISYLEEGKNTWERSMLRAIHDEYGEDLNLPFYWSNRSIINNLIWKIENSRISVRRQSNEVSKDNEDFHIIHGVIMGNFVDMGTLITDYGNSNIADSNQINNFICEGSDHIYYIIGKWNNITEKEDIHVFYNDSKEFNIMRCKHICGGDSEKGILKELFDICLDNVAVI